jgi:hypothetical protein
MKDYKFTNPMKNQKIVSFFLCPLQRKRLFSALSGKINQNE